MIMGPTKLDPLDDARGIVYACLIRELFRGVDDVPRLRFVQTAVCDDVAWNPRRVLLMSVAALSSLAFLGWCAFAQ
jgi:hypothetical protein